MIAVALLIIPKEWVKLECQISAWRILGTMKYLEPKNKGNMMKTFVATLGLAASLIISVGSTSAFANAHEGWVACNSEYRICLRGGSDMSLGSGSSNMSNWSSCNQALAACYQSLN
jgi:hypothetical protein